MTNAESKTQAMRNASTVEVELGPRHDLFVAPDNDRTRQWGVYGRPEMYRADDGSIVVFDPGDMDTYDRALGKLCEAVAYRSTDNGQTWQDADVETWGHPYKVLTLSNGDKVQFLPKRDDVCLREQGLKPVVHVISPNEGALYGLFRYGDIPVDVRGFQVRYKKAGAEEWECHDAVIDAPDLLLAVPVKAKKGDALWPDVPSLWHAMRHSLTGLNKGCTGQECLVEAADDSWLAGVVDHAPTEDSGSDFCKLRCIASTDQGKTWTLRGDIYNDRDMTRFGATEEYSLIRLGNEIVCAYRMDHCSRDPHDMTLLSRSSDNGMTWSTPVEAAETSVTPHLVRLENGVVALTHGRPGVHVQFSTDGCRTWEAHTPIIGKTKSQVLADGEDLMEAKYWSLSPSYSNTRTVITGPDRFLVLYTDFKYGGEKRKAIVVQEIVVFEK